MNAETPAYGLWFLLIINTAVFIIFTFSFTHPRTGHFGLMGQSVLTLLAHNCTSTPCRGKGQPSRSPYRPFGGDKGRYSTLARNCSCFYTGS